MCVRILIWILEKVFRTMRCGRHELDPNSVPRMIPRIRGRRCSSSIPRTCMQRARGTWRPGAPCSFEGGWCNKVWGNYVPHTPPLRPHILGSTGRCLGTCAEERVFIDDHIWERNTPGTLTKQSKSQARPAVGRRRCQWRKKSRSNYNCENKCFNNIEKIKAACCFALRKTKQYSWPTNERLLIRLPFAALAIMVISVAEVQACVGPERIVIYYLASKRNTRETLVDQHKSRTRHKWNGEDD